MDYSNIIKENASTFNDSDALLDFIDSYSSGDNIKDLEDNISAQADFNVPVYYHDIIKEWAETPDCHELTLEVCGEYDQKAGIYKMMQGDLLFYYEQRLQEDYAKLLELIGDQDAE